MRLLIVGTGAMACAIGARLARAGAEPCLAGSWPAALDAIGRRGILLHEVAPFGRDADGRGDLGHASGPGEEVWSAPVAVARIDRLASSFSLALVLVKSYATAAIAAPLARALAPRGLAITLQNGLGNAETLAAGLGQARVAIGVAVMGAALLAPGEVRANPGQVALGSRPDTLGPIAALAELLRAAGIAVTTTSDIEPAVWRKLVANCAINALTALHGVANGVLLADAALRREMCAVAAEAGAVAAARGVRLGTAPDEIALEVARATARNRSSMLQDLERGARTEIDALNGALVREGRRLGVTTPANDLLWRLVREREERSRVSEAGA